MTSPELVAFADAPGVRLLGATRRIRRALDVVDSRLAVPVAISAIARDGRMHPALRAWALTIGELGPARLPGGELLTGDDGEHQVAGLVPGSNGRHDTTCGCGDADSHQGDPWLLDMRDTVTAARDRDGAAVFAAFERAVYSLPARPLPAVTAYVASLAASAHHTFRESGERLDVDALLHLLAAEASTAELWSACGHGYRLTTAVMSAMDMGPSMARNILEPEIAAVEALPSVERMRLILLLGGAMGQIINDEPGAEIELVAHPASDQSRRPDQVLAATMGFKVAIACRTADRDQILAAVEPLPDSALPVYGLANILAVRLRELWAP